jgi:hypothetical protein
MSILHARVERGRIVVDEVTYLSEGTQLTFVMADAYDEMTAGERADLEAEMVRARTGIAAGRGLSGDELLARVRGS